ncbi:hypothetical protein FA09DRAFT_341374 [Tilletiopsis washingtonensis]|uniref:Uncharacterized protein n=1 Tax=Tilletiopsis washingtonensis TaxID=58919 RepID=A0A316Z0B0_9BASI|nr:hypothetical protein FA09DRAFT_341374 [Tilletiopsis washingtonensis]PWN95167.1 hypothetical protein FA09DRAFT_341374 [Tilletiopsis washingtonensis]
MAVSKYASLPDVDTSGLEAFETPDVVSPGVRRVRTYDDSDADDDDDDDSEAAEERTRAAAARGQRAGAEEIDGATLDVREAQRRFESSAGVDAAQADFSQSIAPRRKSKAKPRGGARSPSPHTYESRGFASFSPAAASASASSSAESRAARLRRLQAEAAELAADLAETHAREGGSYEDVVAPPNGAAEASSTTEMMRQVQALRQALGAASVSAAQGEQTEQHENTRN